MPDQSSAATVVLFTAAYPFDVVGEVSFVTPELAALGEYFERVVVVPAVCGVPQCPLPERGLEVDDSLAQVLHPTGPAGRLGFLAEALGSPWLVQELKRCPALMSHPAALRRLAYCAAAARSAGRWLTAQLRRGRWDPESILVYTFWLNYLTAGLGRARGAFPRLPIISRAHGADIYEDRFKPPCVPLHPRAVTAANAVFVASEAGRRHLSKTYPEHTQKFSVAPLGSPDPGFRSAPSADGCFRIVSCGLIDEVKRVELLVHSLSALGRSRPGRRFGWHHMGDGPRRRAVERLCREALPANVSWNLAGRLPPPMVMDHYRRHPADLFVSTSASEGGRPVSMSEALSCGLPVAATSVGGVPELIEADHGWLMPANPSPEVVAEILGEISDRDGLSAHRDAARAYWEDHLRADRLSDRFARRVRALT